MFDLLDMSGHLDELSEEVRNKRRIELPLPLTRDQYFLMKSPARAKERHRLQRIYDQTQKLSDAKAVVPAEIQRGDQLADQGRFDLACEAYCAALADNAMKLAHDVGSAGVLEDERTIGRLGLLADRLLLAGEFQRALTVVDAAIAAAIDPVWLKLIRAEALMLLGAAAEARELFNLFGSDRTLPLYAWAPTILQDFAALRNEGHTHPLMDTIEQGLRADGWTEIHDTALPAAATKTFVPLEHRGNQLSVGASGRLANRAIFTANAAISNRRSAFICAILTGIETVLPQPRTRSSLCCHEIEGVARSLLQSGRSDLVLHSVDQAIRVAPDRLMAHQLMATIEAAFAKPAPPKQPTPKATAVSPPAVIDNLATAKALKSQGLWDDSFAMYCRIHRGLQLKIDQGGINNRVIDDRNLAADEMADLAATLLAAERYEDVLRVTTYVTEHAPARLEAQAYRAHALLLSAAPTMPKRNISNFGANRWTGTNLGKRLCFTILKHCGRPAFSQHCSTKLQTL